MSTPEEQAEKAREYALQWLSSVFAQQAAYTNLVLIGGYASSLAIWGFIHDQLSRPASAWLALSLGTSLVSFIAFEVFKMIYSATYQQKRNANLSKMQSAADWLTALKAMDLEEQWLQVRLMMPVWAISISISVAAALLGACILFVACVRMILGG